MGVGAVTFSGGVKQAVVVAVLRPRPRDNGLFRVMQ